MLYQLLTFPIGTEDQDAEVSRVLSLYVEQGFYIENHHIRNQPDGSIKAHYLLKRVPEKTTAKPKKRGRKKDG